MPNSKVLEQFLCATSQTSLGLVECDAFTEDLLNCKTENTADKGYNVAARLSTYSPRK